jgi:tRNA A-37 threonylcarbamoyl transferase component Bud32
MECPNCHSDAAPDSSFCGKCGTKIQGLHDVLLSATRTLNVLCLELQKDQVIAEKYRIIEPLGKGGMGIVYKAEDIKLKRTVALKFLRPEFLIDHEAKSRFLLEAQAAASLDHPHICAVYEINEIQGQTFIAMPYIEGKSLKDKMHSEQLDQQGIVSLGIQIAEGLAEAHKKGIIHRDIKLANIMISDKNQAKIMDFGLAKLMEGSELTTTTKIMGTVAYMSPEQAKGVPVDTRTDIWSLGVVLYELLAGMSPFETKRDQAMIYSILHENHKPIRKVNPTVPVSLEAIIDRCLQKEPKDRFRSADELSQELRKALVALQSGTSGAGALGKFRFPSRKKEWLKLALPAASVVLAVVVAVIIFGQKSAPKKIADTAKEALSSTVILPSPIKIQEVGGGGRNLRIKAGPDQKVDKGATGLIFSKKEFDQDKSKRYIGQFVVNDVKADQAQMDVINQVGPIEKGDYIEFSKEPQGTLMVRTVPEEAEIYVDDVLKGRSEVKLILAPTKYRITVKKKDFTDKVEVIEVRAKDMVVRNYTLIAKTVTTSQLGNLFVDSNPQGADVFLGNKKTPEGKTPLNLPLGPARYHLRIALANHKEEAQDIEVTGGQNIERTFTLVPATEMIEIDSNPQGADVLIGDKTEPEGKTSFRKAYPVGSYKIKVRKEGFLDHVEDVVISSGTPFKKTIELKAVLVTPKYTLIINSAPEEEAQIYINNQDKGKTPKKIEMTESQVQLRVEKPGYKPHSETIVFTSPELIKTVPLAKLGKGKLSISAYPAARVEIDGEAVEGKVPPLKTVEVNEGFHKIKFIFDDDVEIVKNETVQPNETKRVHCDEGENQGAIAQNASYEFSAYPKAALHLDGAAKGDIPPLKTLRVMEGGHQIIFVFLDKTKTAVNVKISDTVEKAQKKKVHIAFEGLDLTAKENADFLKDIQENKEGDVVIIKSGVPLGIDLDDVPRGDASPGNDLRISMPAKESYRFGLQVRKPNEKNTANIFISRIQEKRVLKFTVQIDLLK